MVFRSPVSRYNGSITDSMSSPVPRGGRSRGADSPGDWATPPVWRTPPASGYQSAGLLRSVVPHHLQSPPTPGAARLLLTRPATALFPGQGGLSDQNSQVLISINCCFLFPRQEKSRKMNYWSNIPPCLGTRLQTV